MCEMSCAYLGVTICWFGFFLSLAMWILGFNPTYAVVGVISSLLGMFILGTTQNSRHRRRRAQARAQRNRGGGGGVGEVGEEGIEVSSAMNRIDPNDEEAKARRRKILDILFPEEEFKEDQKVQEQSKGNADAAVSDDDLKACTICLEPFQKGDKILRGGNCGHTYHRKCILEWLNSTLSNDCPQCRKIMWTEEAYDAIEVELIARRAGAIDDNNIPPV